MNSDHNESAGAVSPDPSYLLKLAEAKMPFGKYAGTRLIHLPEHYVVWFHTNGFPKGELGEMLYTVYEIKLNGLEYLLNPFMTKRWKRDR